MPTSYINAWCMRQLSDAGRADAIAIGEAMRRLEIPPGEVQASPYSRTMETARLMNLGSVATSTDVMNLRAARFFGGREAIVATARRLLSTPPATGANRIIVAHGNVAREATPFYPGEGEGLVFKPDGKGGFDLLGRIPPAPSPTDRGGHPARPDPPTRTARRRTPAARR